MCITPVFKTIISHDLSREHLKMFRGNNNRSINDKMKVFAEEYREAVKAGTKVEVAGDWPEDSPVDKYARAHGFKFRYGGKYVRALSGVVSRGEANGTGEILSDDEEDEYDENNDD